jgi:hypothetical protein
MEETKTIVQTFLEKEIEAQKEFFKPNKIERN